jgi:hypothetical protein
LNGTEQRRVIVLNHLESGALVNAEAAELLGISKRQLQRVHIVGGRGHYLNSRIELGSGVLDLIRTHRDRLDQTAGGV